MEGDEPGSPEIATSPIELQLCLVTKGPGGIKGKSQQMGGLLGASCQLCSVLPPWPAAKVRVVNVRGCVQSCSRARGVVVEPGARLSPNAAGSGTWGGAQCCGGLSGRVCDGFVKLCLVLSLLVTREQIKPRYFCIVCTDTEGKERPRAGQVCSESAMLIAPGPKPVQ